MPVVFKNKNYNNADDQYDSGESTQSSIKPVLNGQSVNQAVLSRPSENLRLRTEELKRNVKKYEDILQSAGFLSYSYNEAVQPGGTVIDGTVEVKWVAADSAFYVQPSSSSSLTILGAVVPGMKYAIDRSAFEAFYSDEVANGNNPKLGLVSPGDSISFRLPLLSAADAASNPLDLIAANTSNPAVEDSTIVTSLYDLLTNTNRPNNISGADGDKALFKSPSQYRLKITTKDTEDGALFRSKLSSASGSNHPVAINVGGLEYSLDAATVRFDEQDSLVAYILEPNRTTFPFDSVASSDTVLIDGTEYFGEGATPSWGSIDLEDAGAPPEEFLIPVASYTGTKIIVHGIGAVDADDVKNAANSTITLSNTGVASTELGGAIESYESTFRLSSLVVNSTSVEGNSLSNDILDLGNNQYLLAIPVSLDIPEIPTGRSYYLDSISVSGSPYLSDTSKPIAVLVQVAKYRSKIQEYADLGESRIVYTAIGNVNDIFGACPSSSEITDNGPVKSEPGYYRNSEDLTYSGTTLTGNLLIQTEEDRAKTILYIVIGADGYNVTAASYDLFFRLTFKTVHGNELPLLASYVPSAP